MMPKEYPIGTDKSSRIINKMMIIIANTIFTPLLSLLLYEERYKTSNSYIN